MGKFQVVFKAGYEVDAKDEEEARAKGRKELDRELEETGTKNFVADVEQTGE